jgi:Calponin homology (CH) domain
VTQGPWSGIGFFPVTPGFNEPLTYSMPCNSLWHDAVHIFDTKSLGRLSVACRRDLLARQDWDLLSGHAWSFLYMQIAKLVVLHRIDAHSFKKLPGLPGDKAASASRIAGSNVYSVAESILLVWLSHYYAEGTGLATAQVSNFHSDLEDGVALACLLHAHWPFLARLRSRVQDNPNHVSEAESNVANVLRMLEAIHCPFKIEHRHILHADPLNMLFFVAYLYEWLPQLIPQPEDIRFDGKLSQHQSRELELSNTSPHALSYVARLHGHEDFSLEASSVTLAPKSTGHVSVNCKPSTGVRQQAYLVLASTREGDAAAVTLVFRLISEVS